MRGKPVLAASEREKVLFPDPANPVTTTRRPIAKRAFRIDVSVPHMPVRSHPDCHAERCCLDSHRRARSTAEARISVPAVMGNGVAVGLAGLPSNSVHRVRSYELDPGSGI